MTMDTKTRIARELASSRVGLQRAELIARLMDIPTGTVDSNLNKMLVSGYVIKTSTVKFYRYSLTPQGRAAYSQIHDDADNELVVSSRSEPTTNPSEKIPAQENDGSMLLGNTPLDPDRSIDAAIIGLVNAIRDYSTAPTVTDRQGVYQLLDVIVASPLYSDYYHGIATQIKHIIEQLEDAA